MKTLVTCTPREFLQQTVKIKKMVAKWLDVTDIMTIRATKPVIEDGMSEAEKRDAYTRQAKENLSNMFDAIAEKHPDETVELLALLCFIDPKEANDHPMSEYFDAITEMMASETVIGFFTSFMRLAKTDTLKA